MRQFHPGFVVYIGLAVAAVNLLTSPPATRLAMAAGGLIATALVAGLYWLWWRRRYGRPG